MNKQNDQTAWLRTIAAYDFALHEMMLYLDTHPTDYNALHLREEYLQKRTDIVGQYEQSFGKYVVQPLDVSGSHGWDWIDDPWPWDYQ